MEGKGEVLEDEEEGRWEVALELELELNESQTDANAEQPEAHSTVPSARVYSVPLEVTTSWASVVGARSTVQLHDSPAESTAHVLPPPALLASATLLGVKRGERRTYAEKGALPPVQLRVHRLHTESRGEQSMVLKASGPAEAEGTRASRRRRRSMCLVERDDEGK